MARRSGQASPSRVKAADRQRKAVELRQQGHTFDAIAEQLGYANEAGARKAVYTALDAFRAEARETVEQARQIELERLDAMHYRLWPRRRIVVVVNTLLKIMARRARLLGLDVPRPPDAGLRAEQLPFPSAVDARETLRKRIEQLRTRMDEETAARATDSVQGMA